MNFGNKEKTEINIPEKPEFKVCVYVGYGKYKFGELSFLPENDYFKKDMGNDGFEQKYIGTTTIKLDTSGLDLDIDVRGIMINKIKEQIKEKEADHVRDINFLKARLSELTAISYEGE